MVENLRKCFPTSYELTCRNNFNKKDFNIDLGFKEFSFIKIFSDDEMESNQFDKNILKKDYKNFCKDNKSLVGLFYPQFTENNKISENDLKIIDDIQDIKETGIRLIHFKDNVSFEEFKERLNSFILKNDGKRLIPVLNINVKKNSDLILLGKKTEYIKNRFKECIINYSNWKNYNKAWKIVSSKLYGIDWYVFRLPTNEFGGFSLIIYCLLLGANATCHKLYRGGGNGTPNPALFLNSDMSLKTINNCDNGIQKYGMKDRINFLIDDGRKSYVRLFAKWDRIVQANAFCMANKKINDLNDLESLKHSCEYFKQ